MAKQPSKCLIETKWRLNLCVNLSEYSLKSIIYASVNIYDEFKIHEVAHAESTSTWYLDNYW